VIVSSPEIPELLAICDRILVVNSGCLAGEIDRFSPDFNESEILRMMHAGIALTEPNAGAATTIG
jgi:ABC-type sugar transport system ATPase subunit